MSGLNGLDGLSGLNGLDGSLTAALRLDTDTTYLGILIKDRGIERHNNRKRRSNAAAETSIEAQVPPPVSAV